MASVWFSFSIALIGLFRFAVWSYKETVLLLSLWHGTLGSIYSISHRLGHPIDFPSGFPTKIYYAFLIYPHACYIARPSHPRSYHPSSQIFDEECYHYMICVVLTTARIEFVPKSWLRRCMKINLFISKLFHLDICTCRKASFDLSVCDKILA
jgi:hypothetical protein